MRLLLSVLLFLLPAAGVARSLYWSAFDVDARLDAEGALHVTERQSIVFDGAWNGGERIFNIRPGQRLHLHSITRVDPRTGRRTDVTRGSLDDVDEWDWEARHVLRWRSRKPADPPFRQETIVYEIDYTLRGALRETREGYLLDHDFAFPARIFPIENFTLDLELDSAWEAAPEMPRELAIEQLPPGRGVVVTGLLRHTAPGSPAAADSLVPDHQVHALFFAALVLVVFKVLRLWRAETAAGRREVPQHPEPIQPAWLEENLFSLRPEEAGALWDRRVAAPEVAALIARLVGEGRLVSRVTDPGSWRKRPTLELELAAERGDFTGYERTLIDKLFFDGRTRVDTLELKKHYKSTGFDPAEAIRSSLETRLKKVAPGGDEPVKPAWKPTFLLFVLCLAAFVGEAATRGMAALGPLIASLAVVAPVPVLWAYIAAATYRARLGRPPRAWLGFLIPLALLFLLTFAAAWVGTGGRLVFADLRHGLFGVLALVFFFLLVANSVLNTAHTRERPTVVARRQLLAAARRFFKDELERETPALEDGWFPYILAFGLSKQADAWARHFAPAGDSALSTSTWSGGSRPGSGWTGGGGAFGGAGATAAWTAAATGMATGVSAPSSGGSGGGGGSSGGGGGGGW